MSKVIPFPSAPTSPISAQKRNFFAAWLQESLVCIAVDSRTENVALPDQWMNKKTVLLNFSLRFGLSDLTYNGWGVRATLSFDTIPFYVQIPWESIFSMVHNASGQSITWKSCVPAESGDPAESESGDKKSP